MRVRLDEYNAAAAKVAYGWIDRRTPELAPSLWMFPRAEVEHVRIARVTSASDEVERIEPVRRHDEGTFDISEVVAGRFGQLRESLDQVAADRARVMVGFWQEQVDRGMASGTIVKAQGPPSWDSVMDALDSLQFGFDEQGQPQVHTVEGPSAAPLLKALGPRDAAQERRWQELMTDKIGEWRTRQRDRRMA